MSMRYPGRSLVRRAVLLAAGLVLLTAPPAAAQWSQAYEQFYLPAKHNWKFRQNFRTADRLFNAFDYGHGILYETLYARPDAPPSLLEDKEYDFITKKLLVRPPRVPLEESAIEIEYAKLAPEAKIMFDWAHILHRQLYDVLADERLSREEQDRAAAELIRYYKSRADIAFSSIPKTMQLMEGQYYSTVFRQRYPKFNGLIWAYHWLQIGLYEPLIAGRTPEERRSGIALALGRFWEMLLDPPGSMPRVMPMTSAIAPRFTERHPRAAAIFDNLHMMHDIVSDVLAADTVPHERKREVIYAVLAELQDTTRNVMSHEHWLMMADMMGGIGAMGGPVPLPDTTRARPTPAPPTAAPHRPSAWTTAATSSPPTSGWCWATILRPSPVRGRSWGRRSRRSSATCPAHCGSWWARRWAALCRTSSSCSPPCAVTASRWARSPRKKLVLWPDSRPCLPSSPSW